MVKQPTAEQSEFQMSSEDFPALPGTQHTDGVTSNVGNMLNNSIGGVGSVLDGADKGSAGAVGISGLEGQIHDSGNDKVIKRGVQTSPGGEFSFVKYK